MQLAHASRYLIELEKIIEISINSGKKTDIVLDTDREIAPNN
jgi:hypothetical protein